MGEISRRVLNSLTLNFVEDSNLTNQKNYTQITEAASRLYCQKPLAQLEQQYRDGFRYHKKDSIINNEDLQNYENSFPLVRFRK
jgi:hypothetical protein